MYRRDYILRIIERFGRMLLALRDRILRREVSTQDVIAQLGELAGEAGIDLDIARRLDPDSLLIWLAPGHDVDQPRLWLIGELLYLVGTQATIEESGDGTGDLRRALAVFRRLPPDWRPSDGFATAGERAEEVERLLRPNVE